VLNTLSSHFSYSIDPLGGYMSLLSGRKLSLQAKKEEGSSLKNSIIMFAILCLPAGETNKTAISFHKKIINGSDGYKYVIHSIKKQGSYSFSYSFYTNSVLTFSFGLQSCSPYSLINIAIGENEVRVKFLVHNGSSYVLRPFVFVFPLRSILHY
jgi:hypothetical protein